MPEKSEAEKKDDAVEKTSKLPAPEPMVPPMVPTLLAQKVKDGTRFWVWIGVPLCVPYDEVQKLARTGRVALEEKLEGMIKAQIGKPRKQKGKDEWVVKLEYPVDPHIVVGDTCKKAVGQIRAAIGDE